MRCVIRISRRVVFIVGVRHEVAVGIVSISLSIAGRVSHTGNTVQVVTCKADALAIGMKDPGRGYSHGVVVYVANTLQARVLVDHISGAIFGGILKEGRVK